MDSVVYVFGGLGNFSFILLLLVYLDVRAPRKQQGEDFEAILTRLTEIRDRR
ncbi:MAG TPA: hypothetical protein VIT41_06095 [Microlunatus sp.]